MWAQLPPHQGRLRQIDALALVGGPIAGFEAEPAAIVIPEQVAPEAEPAIEDASEPSAPMAVAQEPAVEEILVATAEASPAAENPSSPNPASDEEDFLLAQLLGTWDAPAAPAPVAEAGPEPQPAALVAATEPELAAPELAMSTEDDMFLLEQLLAGEEHAQRAPEPADFALEAAPVAQQPVEVEAELETAALDEMFAALAGGMPDGVETRLEQTPANFAEISGADLLLGDMLSGLGQNEEPDPAKPVRYEPKSRAAERLPDARQELERLVATTDAELGSSIASFYRERRAAGLNADRHIAFQAGSRLFALPLESVLETDMVPRVTFVPGAGNAIRGVANLRGELLSIVDLRDLLSMEQQDRVHERLLVVRQGRRAVAGFVIDSVLGIVPVRKEDRQPVPEVSGDPASAMLDSVVEYRDRLMGVLDAARLVDAAGLDGPAQ